MESSDIFSFSCKIECGVEEGMEGGRKTTSEEVGSCGGMGGKGPASQTKDAG